MERAPVYVNLTAVCVYEPWRGGDGSNAAAGTRAPRTVVVRFEDEHEYARALEDDFTSAVDCFNAGLPAGWLMDGPADADGTVAPPDAYRCGYVRFHDE